MFKLLSLAFALLVIASHCDAQTVALAIVRVGCGSPLSPLLAPPASQQEREQMSAEWVDTDELAVESWDDESGDALVDPSTAKVHMDGATATLSYSHKRVGTDQRKAIPGCQFLVKLFFTISGLPRSHYRLRIEGSHGVVRPLAIDG